MEENVDTEAVNVKEDEEEVEEADFKGINPPNSGSRLKEEADRRRSDFKGSNPDGQSLEPEEFKDRLERPAYERKQLMFFQIPDHSRNEMSRYKLDDDNELLGDNKFLHDNVD